MSLSAEDPRHGTNNAYQNLGCRCQPCRDAHAVEQAVQRDKRYAAPIAVDDTRHGTAGFYSNHGCRCALCTIANNRQKQLWREQHSTRARTLEKPAG